MEYISTAIPNTVTVDGIVTVLRHYYTDEDIPCGERHDFPELLYINRGRHIAVVGGQKISLSAGQMLIYPPGVFHTVDSPSGAEGLIVSFEMAPDAVLPLCGKVFTLSAGQKQTLLQIMGTGLECFVPLGEKELAGGKRGMVPSPRADGATLQRLKKQLEFFLADIFRDSVLRGENRKDLRKDRDYGAVCAFLEENIGNALTVEEIARGSGMSVSKLKALVREKSGGGAVELFNALKIEKAKMMIGEGKYNFTAIALELGFGSLHYFSRTFKKYTGVSPSEYEKSI